MLLVIEEHFDFGRMESIIASEESFGIAASITVTRRRFVRVAKVGVGSCLDVAVIDDVKVVATSERRTIAVVCVDSIVVVSVDGCFEWF